MIEETPVEITVYTLGLTRATFKKTEAGAPQYKAVKFEKADLVEHVQTLIRESEARKQIDRSHQDHWRRFSRQACEACEACEFFVLANARASQNQEQLAHELMVAAKELLYKSRDVSVGKRSLQDAISNDLAHTATWRIILKFGSPEISRETILKDLQQFQKHFPQSPHFGRAKATADMLTQMVAEDRAHIVPKELDALTVREKVSERIFRLRDQNGMHFGKSKFLRDIRPEDAKR